MSKNQDSAQFSDKSIHEVDKTIYEDDHEVFNDKPEFEIENIKSINSIKDAVKFTQNGFRAQSRTSNDLKELIQN